MSTLQDRIQAALLQHTEILKGLSETAKAPSQLYQHQLYIADLDAQIASTETHVAQLRTKTAQELTDHRKYNESTFRRFAHTVSGRKDQFSEKAAREERDFIDATHTQKAAEDDLACIRQLRAEAETTKRGFEAEVSRNTALQASMTELHISVFGGPTPDFPPEDVKERAFENANLHFQSLQLALQKEQQMLPLLRQLQHGIIQASVLLQNAARVTRMYSTYITYINSSYEISNYTRHMLKQAEVWLAQSRMFRGKILMLDSKSQVKEMRVLETGQGSPWGDILTVLNTYGYPTYGHIPLGPKILETETCLGTAKSLLDGLVREAGQRERSFLGMIGDAEQGMQRARRELQSVREEAFRRVANGELLYSADQVVLDNGDVSAISREADTPPAYSI